ncbi:Type II secretion system (T2SS), protein G [bacterium JGI 053]|jgi:hypothetical protein|nr:Type II secretion system (T2SS), protein G [bacterium JGI 053]
METLRWLITLYLEERGAVPERLDDAFPPGPETRWTTYSHDAWGNHYRYARVGTDYELRSAGADGRFGTPDDIVATRLKGTPRA